LIERQRQGNILETMSLGRPRPRVLLADDDAGMHAAISRLISPSCDLVGCVGDTATLFKAVADLHPVVVLLDFSLPGGLNALEVCRRLTMRPGLRVVAFTAHDGEEYRRMAADAGASAFVWKMQAATDLVPTIHAVVEATGESSEEASV
jgi:two-component system phosphate regulon response regulator PhoB